jgi:hypothetical protein
VQALIARLRAIERANDYLKTGKFLATLGLPQESGKCPAFHLRAVLHLLIALGEARPVVGSRSEQASWRASSSLGANGHELKFPLMFYGGR